MAEKTIGLDDVRHVAKLARLHLSEQELERFTRKLGSILEYVGKISELDVRDVPPMEHALPIHNILREDIPQPALPPEAVLQNAPERDGDFFSVPKILGADEDYAG